MRRVELEVDCAFNESVIDDPEGRFALWEEASTMQARAEAAEAMIIEYKEDVLKLRKRISGLVQSQDSAKDCMRVLESEAAALRSELDRQYHRHALVECDSCAMRGRDCDGGDHCNNCEARMDGDIAATSDVCRDCWQAAIARTAAEQRVLEAMAALYIERTVFPDGQSLTKYGDVMPVVRAELARRESKV